MARMGVAAHRCGLPLLMAVLGFAPAAVPAQQPRSAAPPPLISWPGFATALQDGRYVVVFVDSGRRAQLPPAGARLIGCDGESAAQLARERLERSTRTDAARLLWDTGNPVAPPPPASCIFETAAGRSAYRMTYSPAPPAVISAAIAAAAGQSRPLPHPRLF